MGWTLTEDLERFRTRADGFLRSDPVANNVALIVTEDIRAQGPVSAVYTPAAHRRRGYGAAVTAAVTRAAQDAGAAHVVLFTDLANPTSNGVYQRLGYRPVEDRVVLAFA